MLTLPSSRLLDHRAVPLSFRYHAPSPFLPLPIQVHPFFIRFHWLWFSCLLWGARCLTRVLPHARQAPHHRTMSPARWAVISFIDLGTLPSFPPQELLLAFQFQALLSPWRYTVLRLLNYLQKLSRNPCPSVAQHFCQEQKARQTHWIYGWKPQSIVR